MGAASIGAASLSAAFSTAAFADLPTPTLQLTLFKVSALIVINHSTDVVLITLVLSYCLLNVQFSKVSPYMSEPVHIPPHHTAVDS